MEATLPADGARKLPYLLPRASKHTGSEFAFFQVAKINKETCRYIGIQKYFCLAIFIRKAITYNVLSYYYYERA